MSLKNLLNKKVITTVSIIITAVLIGLLCGCGNNKGNAQIESTDSIVTNTEAASDKTTTVISETVELHTEIQTSYSHEIESTSSEVETALPNIVSSYSEQYQTTETFQDMLIPLDYLLVGPEHVVYIRAFSGADQVTVIKISEIERVEDAAVADIHTIRIYDKTGSCIEMQVTSEDSRKIQDLIK